MLCRAAWVPLRANTGPLSKVEMYFPLVVHVK